MGFSPRDKAIREARELEEAKKRASTYQNEPQTDRNARGGIVGQLQGNEQAARLYRLLSNGRKFGVIDIMEQMRIADPRAVVRTLRKMGVEAIGTHHNDIMIGDRKVCGTACRITPHGCIVHSTMLYDTNMQHMQQALTPSQQKLAKNGVESVRQRITLLKDYTSLTLDEVKVLILRTLCDDERMLTAEEISEIEQIEKQYIQ